MAVCLEGGQGGDDALMSATARRHVVIKIGHELISLASKMSQVITGKVERAWQSWCKPPIEEQWLNEVGFVRSMGTAYVIKVIIKVRSSQKLPGTSVGCKA